MKLKIEENIQAICDFCNHYNIFKCLCLYTIYLIEDLTLQENGSRLEPFEKETKLFIFILK
jgi:hypothetical protein